MTNPKPKPPGVYKNATVDSPSVPSPEAPTSPGAHPSDETAPTLERQFLELQEALYSSLGELIRQEVRALRQAPEDALLTLEDVAEILAVSPRTVETLVAEGSLVPLRIRGTRRFTRQAVDGYLRTCAKPKQRRRTSRRAS